MHDHRVTPARAERFDQVAARPSTARELTDGLDSYYQRSVKTRRLPDFVMRRLNHENVVSDLPTGGGSPKREVYLARVLILNGLRLLFQYGHAKRILGFRGFSETSWSGITRWLDERLSLASMRGDFIERILNLIYLYSRHEPFQPSWCTTWTAISPFLPLRAPRWMQVLGLSTPSTTPIWLIVLKYQVREAGTLCRPTQLDCGRSYLHFPSPPAAPLYRGGHPVDLRYNPRSTDVIPEFIHKQIWHPLRHWTDAGSRCERVTLTSAGDLGAQRSAHHALLQTVYGPSVPLWMPACV